MHARHVVSLELARKLKDAGFPQDTEFVWRKSVHKDTPTPQRKWKLCFRETPGVDIVWDQCAAPLASEVAEQLPDSRVRTLRWRNMWISEEFPNDDPLGPAYIRGADYTMPDALAALWLALKEK